MKVIGKGALPSQGKYILIYGNTGVGKTTSILQSAPGPVLYIATEPRNPLPSIEAAGGDAEIDVARYSSWFELMEFLQDSKNTERYASIAIDSLTYLMNISLAGEIEDEAFDARTMEEKKKKPIVSQAKMSMEGYGGLSSQMFRLMKALGRLSEEGKVVIATALLQEHPKWDRELAAAPALKGREFPTSMPGFFDLIGLVEPRVGSDGKIIYPPVVSFESPDGSFLAKFTGAGDKRKGLLDFRKILKTNSNDKD
nr:hypothetical protein 13 [Desulfobacterales bacterium]